MKGLETAIINRLKLLGDECVVKAVTEGSYTDQTGNLRSSKGYVIVANGKVIDVGGFGAITLPASQRSSGGEDGKKDGQKFAEGKARKFKDGYALIVVAGMNYAAYVEATNRNVLSTAEHYAEAELPRMLQALKRKTSGI